MNFEFSCEFLILLSAKVKTIDTLRLKDFNIDLASNQMGSIHPKTKHTLEKTLCFKLMGPFDGNLAKTCRILFYEKSLNSNFKKSIKLQYFEFLIKSKLFKF